jgi:hypothetical protein
LEAGFDLLRNQDRFFWRGQQAQLSRASYIPLGLSVGRRRQDEQGRHATSHCEGPEVISKGNVFHNFIDSLSF